MKIECWMETIRFGYIRNFLYQCKLGNCPLGIFRGGEERGVEKGRFWDKSFGRPLKPRLPEGYILVSSVSSKYPTRQHVVEKSHLIRRISRGLLWFCFYECSVDVEIHVQYFQTNFKYYLNCRISSGTISNTSGTKSIFCYQCKLQYYFSFNKQDKYFHLPTEHKVFCLSSSIEAGLIFLLPMGPELQM